MATSQKNWTEIANHPLFLELHRKKKTFLYGCWAVSAGCYFLLLLGAGYTPHIFNIEVFGNINVGYLFALAQFAISFGIAIIYGWKADKTFDRLTNELLEKIK